MSDLTHPLSVLSRGSADDVKSFVELLLPMLSPINVLQNRTGIVMLPATDSVKGTHFHVGEVLIAEAHVRLAALDVEGYGVCMGRDLQHALAMAILDAALRANKFTERIQQFVAVQRVALVEADAALMRTVEGTRVEMETF